MTKEERIAKLVTKMTETAWELSEFYRKDGNEEEAKKYLREYLGLYCVMKCFEDDGYLKDMEAIYNTNEED